MIEHFAKRCLSFAVIVAILVVMLSSNPGTLTLGCLFEAELLREYLEVVASQSSTGQKLWLALLGIPLVLWATSPEALAQAFTLASVACMLGGMVFPQGPKPFEFLVIQLFGLLYVGFLGLGHAALLFQTYGCSAVVFVIWVTACGENGALFVGSLVKGPKFFPRVSPNKTLSGVLAQVGTSVLGSLAFPFVLRQTVGSDLLLTQWQLIECGVGLGIFGVLGDLFESFMKRCYSKKDMGGVLPGWGGLFDRMDGLLLNWPLTFYFLHSCYHVTRLTSVA